MSEYQYYEFRAVDRSLTREEMAELRELSTRAEITPTSFTNTYNFGDFRGDPLKLVERYFDVFLYVANWGSHELLLRIPRRMVDVKEIQPYLLGEATEYHEAGDNIILELRSEGEGGYWEQGEGWLPDILPVREALIRGDRRALYIAWLLEVSQTYGDAEDVEDEDEDVEEEDEDVGEDVEPPVPPGLGKLSPALERLAEFLRIDQDLLAVASEHSANLEREDLDEAAFQRWVAALAAAEKDDLLFRLARGEAGLGVDLQRRFVQEHRTAPAPASSKPRTARQLMRLARQHAERRQRLQAERAARERNRQLDALAAREPETWRQVEALIEEKQGRSYDEAVSLLKDLRDLAAREGRREAFASRIQDLRVRYKSRSALRERLDSASLTA